METMDLGLPELIFLFVLALLLFGPRRLPEIGRQLGKLFADFKRASNEFQNQLQDEVKALEAEIDNLEEKPAENRILAPAAVRPDFTTAREEYYKTAQAEPGAAEGTDGEVKTAPAEEPHA